MCAEFRYERGDLISDVKLGGLPYRVERRLRDEDTDVGLYVIKRVDDNMELLRNAKLIDNPSCFALPESQRKPDISNCGQSERG